MSLWRSWWRTASLSVPERNLAFFFLSRLLVELARSSRGLVQKHIAVLHTVLPSSFSPVVRSRDANRSPASAPQDPPSGPTSGASLYLCAYTSAYTPRISWSRPAHYTSIPFPLDGRGPRDAPPASSLKVNRSEVYRWQTYSKQE